MVVDFRDPRGPKLSLLDLAYTSVEFIEFRQNLNLFSRVPNPLTFQLMNLLGHSIFNTG